MRGIVIIHRFEMTAIPNLVGWSLYRYFEKDQEKKYSAIIIIFSFHAIKQRRLLLEWITKRVSCQITVKYLRILCGPRQCPPQKIEKEKNYIQIVTLG